MRKYNYISYIPYIFDIPNTRYIGQLWNVKKLIDIPDPVVKDLKKLAVDSERDLKNYIQDLLVHHVEQSKKRDFKPLPLKK